MNIPVLSNVGGAFSYVIVADDFSADYQENLQFDTTSFVFSLTVVGYQSGEISMEIYNADSSEVFKREVTSSTVISEFPSFQPRFLHLNLDGFTGQVNLSIASGN